MMATGISLLYFFTKMPSRLQPDIKKAPACVVITTQAGAVVLCPYATGHAVRLQHVPSYEVCIVSPEIHGENAYEVSRVFGLASLEFPQQASQRHRYDKHPVAAVDGHLVQSEAEDDVYHKVYGKPRQQHLQEAVVAAAEDAPEEQHHDDRFYRVVDPRRVGNFGGAPQEDVAKEILAVELY